MQELVAAGRGMWRNESVSHPPIYRQIYPDLHQMKFGPTAWTSKLFLLPGG
jgi:hypothetical protein